MKHNFSNEWSECGSNELIRKINNSELKIQGKHIYRSNCIKRNNYIICWKLLLRWKQNTKILIKIINGTKIFDDRKQVENNCGKRINLWKVIDQKLGEGNRKDNEINHLYNDKNNKITENIDFANPVNKQFSSFGKKIGDKIVQPYNTKVTSTTDEPKIYFYLSNKLF